MKLVKWGADYVEGCFSPVAGILVDETPVDKIEDAIASGVSVPLPGFWLMKQIAEEYNRDAIKCFSPVAGILVDETRCKEKNCRISPKFQSRCRDFG